MTTTNENAQFPVEVPGPYIKDKAVDYDAEIYAAMGASLPVGGFLVRPPSLGVFSLLETYESPFIATPEECSVMEFWRVLYINEHRRECMQAVMEWAYPDKGKHFDVDDKDTWESFDWAVYNWGESVDLSYGDAFDDAYIKIQHWFSLAFEGLDMIPSTGGSNSVYWFGADTMAALSVAADESIQRVLWDEPMCAIGHKLAAMCRYNGNDKIARKKDPEDVKRQCNLARERIRKGELHPWQIKDPANWPLTKKQIEYAPKLKNKFERLLEEQKNG